jgi:hypothetical protein
LCLAVELVAFLRQVEALERMSDAGRDRLEQRRLCLVEALVVEPRDADNRPNTTVTEPSADERPCAHREQIEPLITTRRLDGTVEKVLFDEALCLLGSEPIRAHDGSGAAVPACEDKRDLRLECLAQLGGNDLAELPLGLRPVEDRDDLGAPRGLDEPPQQLVMGVSRAR